MAMVTPSEGPAGLSRPALVIAATVALLLLGLSSIGNSPLLRASSVAGNHGTTRVVVVSEMNATATLVSVDDDLVAASLSHRAPLPASNSLFASALPTNAPGRPWEEHGKPDSSSQQPCGTANTTGKYGDATGSGNDVVDDAADRASLLPNASWVQFLRRPNHGHQHGKAPKTSRLQRATADKTSLNCYYRVTNFCVHESSLVFLQSSGTPQDAETAAALQQPLRLCNELRRKVNLRYRVASHPPAAARWVQAAEGSGVVAACWQFYGYHLMQCVVSAFAVAAQHGLVSAGRPESRASELWLYNHGASMPKETREHYTHQMYMGGVSSWSDDKPANATANDKYRPRLAPIVYPLSWWPLWSQATLAPSQVHELFRPPVGSVAGSGWGDASTTVCYAQGLIGTPAHPAISGPQRRAHRQHLDSLFFPSATTPDAARDATIRVVIAQRGARGPGLASRAGRRFLNLDAMVAALRSHASVERLRQQHVAVDVRALDWAALPFAEQYRIAATADVIFSTHGAGNSWIVAMRPRTVFVEVWPQCVVRPEYLVLAKQHNVRFVAMCLHRPQTAKAGTPEARFSFLHENVNVPISQLLDTFDDALQYRLAVRCLNGSMSAT